jgi:hypothetical protein
MDDLNSTLTDLYFWCFAEAPDLVTANSAGSLNQVNTVTIQQSELPGTPIVWCVGAQSEVSNITAFETDLLTGIDALKQAWINKDLSN